MNWFTGTVLIIVGVVFLVLVQRALARHHLQQFKDKDDES